MRSKRSRLFFGKLRQNRPISHFLQDLIAREAFIYTECREKTNNLQTFYKLFARFFVCRKSTIRNAGTQINKGKESNLPLFVKCLFSSARNRQFQAVIHIFEIITNHLQSA